MVPPGHAGAPSCRWSNQGNETRMGATKESEPDKGQLRLLLVGDKEDFAYLRDLLSRTGDKHLALGHARSPEQALARLGKRSTTCCCANTHPTTGWHCVCCRGSTGPPLTRG